MWTYSSPRSEDGPHELFRAVEVAGNGMSDGEVLGDTCPVHARELRATKAGQYAFPGLDAVLEAPQHEQQPHLEGFHDGLVHRVQGVVAGQDVLHDAKRALGVAVGQREAGAPQADPDGVARQGRRVGLFVEEVDDPFDDVLVGVVGVPPEPEQGGADQRPLRLGREAVKHTSSWSPRHHLRLGLTEAAGHGGQPKVEPQAKDAVAVGRARSALRTSWRSAYAPARRSTVVPSMSAVSWESTVETSASPARCQCSSARCQCTADSVAAPMAEAAWPAATAAGTACVGSPAWNQWWAKAASTVGSARSALVEPLEGQGPPPVPVGADQGRERVGDRAAEQLMVKADAALVQYVEQPA